MTRLRFGRSWVRIPAWQIDLPLQNAQKSPGPSEASYSIGKIGFIPEVKRQMSEAGHSPPSSIEVKNACSHIFILVYEVLYLSTICGLKYVWHFINLLKPSGLFTYHQGLTFKNSTWRSLCVDCFVRIPEQTATFALNSIN